MRKKMITGLILGLLILGATSSHTLASSYFGYQDFGGTWYDVNKTQNNDGSMCWAATAANILAWGNWGTSQFSDSTAIYNEYKVYWNNTTGQVPRAWAWWLNGGTYTGMKQEGGGGYWPNNVWTNHYTAITSLYYGNAMSDIDASLHAGYGVVLNIRWAGWLGLGHGLTAWGIEKDEAGNYTGLWLTDSDDSVTDLVYYSMMLSGNRWYFPNIGRYDGYFIYGYYGLSENPAPVPVPPTVWLLGSTLIGLIGLRRKFINI